jgi:hypothetical protein
MVSRSALRQAGATWIVFVVAMSLQPARLRATSHGAAHLVLHLLLFGLAAIIPLLLSGNWTQEAARAFSVFCLGVGVEIAQGLMSRHHPEWRDVKVDGIGVLAVFLAIRFCRIRRAMRETGNQNS